MSVGIRPTHRIAGAFLAVKIEFAGTKAFALRRRWLAAKYRKTNNYSKTICADRGDSVGATL